MQNLVKRSLLMLSLSLMSPVFLAGCQSFPSVMSPLSGDGYFNGYQSLSFAPRWSPTGDRVAIRTYRESNNPPSTKYLDGDPNDTVSLFDGKTGKIQQTWALPFAKDSRQPRLQWSDQGDKLFVLRSIMYEPGAGLVQSYVQAKQPAPLIQSLVLYTLTPGVEAAAVREIYLPDSLKDLSTLRFEHPALSPDGKQLSLMRVSQAGETESYELVLLDLSAAKILSRIPLEGKAQQSAAWGKDGELFALTLVGQTGQAHSVLWKLKDQKAEKQFSAWSDQASFNLSPDRSHVLLSFNDEHARPEGSEQVPAANSFWEGDRLHLILDLASAKQNWFRTMPLLEDNPAQEQAVEHWDRLNRVTYQINFGDNQPRPAAFKDRGNYWIEVQSPGQSGSTMGFDLKAPTAEIDKQIRPLLSKNLRFTYTLTQPNLAANGPDGRALMILDHSPSPPSQNANLFYIWDPSKSQLLPLESKLALLVTPCLSCTQAPYGVPITQ